MTMTARAVLLASAANMTAAPIWAQDSDDVTMLDEIRIEADAAQALLGNAEITDAEIENRKKKHP